MGSFSGVDIFKVGIHTLDELFRTSVLKMLKDEGRFEDTLINNILTLEHNSGSSVHNKVVIHAGDEQGIEKLAQYIIRNTFSLIKLNIVEKTGTIIYHSKMSHGGNKRNFLLFIAAVMQHIPERLVQMVRYVGGYSNRMRGDRQKNEKCS